MMNSKLYDFLKTSKYEMHSVCESKNQCEIVWVCIPFYALEDFVKSCENDTHKYDFDDDQPPYEISLRSDCVIIDLNDIIENLDEDIEKYKELCR